MERMNPDTIYGFGIVLLILFIYIIYKIRKEMVEKIEYYGQESKGHNSKGWKE